METLNIRGKVYHRAEDDLFYRDEIINSVTYSVPMYVNRLPYGWQVRLARKGESYFSKSFADPKSINSSLDKNILSSLRSATKEIKSQLNKDQFDTREQCKKKHTRYLMLDRNISSNNIPGVNVVLVFPKPEDRETTPYIRMFSQLSIKGRKRLTSPSYTTSIFTLTKNSFESKVKKIVLHRKYMEAQYFNGKVYSPNAVAHFTREKELSLLQDVDLSIFKLDNFVAEIEKKWQSIIPSSPFPVETSQTNAAITVRRISNTEFPRSQSKDFRFTSYGSIDLTNRISSLYAKFLQTSCPIRKHTKKKQAPSETSSIKNKQIQTRTGITGVTFWAKLSRPAIYFVSVFYQDGNLEPTTKRFSVGKYGLLEAFKKARMHFNEQRNRDESETALMIHYNRILPILLSQITQEHIDYLGIANDLEGVVYSKVI